MGDLAALEHDVLDAALRQLVAHRQPAVAGADHDHIGPRGLAHARHTLRVVTVTSVGLVTMSNTAERFCDCATSAAICSGVASASIS